MHVDFGMIAKGEAYNRPYLSCPVCGLFSNNIEDVQDEKGGPYDRRRVTLSLRCTGENHGWQLICESADAHGGNRFRIQVKPE